MRSTSSASKQIFRVCSSLNEKVVQFWSKKAVWLNSRSVWTLISQINFIGIDKKFSKYFPVWMNKWCYFEAWWQINSVQDQCDDWIFRLISSTLKSNFQSMFQFEWTSGAFLRQDGKLIQFMISVMIEFSDFHQHWMQIFKDFSSLNEQVVQFKARWQINTD